MTETPSTAVLARPRFPSGAGAGSPLVEIVVPVRDEERGLDASIRTLQAYLIDQFTVPWAITIADNASTDTTAAIAQHLASTLDGVRVLHLDEKGRGRALRAAWSASDAQVVAYMDVDLSTDLDALLPLVAPLLSGHSDVAIGTRLASNARVVRGPKRELISRGYNLLLRTTLRAGFSDAQCGFKALRADVARELLPLVEDQGWFFDTELLVLAEHNGLRIHEVPVDWVDDPVSRVDIVRTATDDLRGVWRMLRRFAIGDGALTSPPDDLTRPTTPVDPRLGPQVVRFASIGIVSTVVFAALFALLDGPFGPVGADVVALLVCGFANTAANRRLTFTLRGRAGRARHYVAGTLLGLLPLALTLAALAVLAVLGVSSLGVTLVTLTAANLLATVARFLLLRHWVFRP
ncbi:MAG TPA: glycosyltransferase [Acidimicrobiia bacterium]